MRLIPCLKTALLGGMVFSLAACSYVTDLFPDKQKQYRYSSELPDLEIPPDLTDTKADGKGTDTDSRPKGDKYSAYKDSGDGGGQAKAATVDTPTPSRTGKKHKPVKHNDSSMTLAENMENAALIEMQEPFEESWNDVGRALGRMKIEITDQNRSDGVYYVYYGGKPPKKDQQETSIWEDMASVFSSGKKDEAKEFHIKLDDKDTATNVYVVDQDGKAVSEGTGLELLKRLHKKLISLDKPDTDADETKEEPKPTDDAKKP